jgi:hypothetical protein
MHDVTPRVVKGDGCKESLDRMLGFVGGYRL